MPDLKIPQPIALPKRRKGCVECQQRRMQVRNSAKRGIFIPSQRVAVVPDATVQVLWYKVGRGSLGLGGVTGYKGLVVPPDSVKGWNFISAHAPSAIMISSTEPIRLAGFFNTGCAPVSSAVFFANGNYVGQLRQPGITTDDQFGSFTLERGEHLLEVILNESSNTEAQTIWVYKKQNGHE